MIHIDYRDSRPIYEQIVDTFKKHILAGIMEPGQKMPSVRELASQLAINPNTIQRAYRELEAEGYIVSVRGKGSFVSETADAGEAHKAELLAQFDDVVAELQSLGVSVDSLIERIQGGEND